MPHGAIPFPFGDCRICEDKATGIHYGVATCEGCKGFFKRSLPKRDKFSCFFGGQCQVTRLNRNRCKACRFKRCLDNGMAVEAVKMGRIPKLEKERALYEAHCATGGEADISGSTSSDVQFQAGINSVPDHPQIERGWRDLLALPAVSLSSAIALPTYATSRNNPMTSSQVSSHLMHAMSSDIQDEYKMMDLSDDFPKMALNHFNNTLDKCGDNKICPQAAKNGYTVTDPLDRNNRMDGSFLHAKKNTGDIGGCFNTTKLASNNSLSNLSIEAIPNVSQEYSSNGQPPDQWRDNSSINNTQSRTVYHSMYNNYSPPTAAVDTYRTKALYSKKSRGLLHQRSSDPFKFLSLQGKKQILEKHVTNKKQSEVYGSQGSLFSADSPNHSNIVHSSNSSPLSQHSLYGEQLFQQQSSYDENTAQELEKMSLKNTFHCSNTFTDIKNSSPTARPSTISCNINLDLDIGKTRLEDQHSTDSDRSLNKPNSDAPNISMWQPASQNGSSSTLLSNQHQPPQYSLSHPPLSDMLNSESNSTEVARYFNQTTSVSPQENRKRSPYSPNMVKVLLNQVGGERLKGLKQHIMTGIARECAPEQFQAAADLLRQYSEESRASSSNSDTNACTPSPISVQQNFTCSHYGQDALIAMDKPDTLSFDSRLDTCNRITDAFDFQRSISCPPCDQQPENVALPSVTVKEFNGNSFNNSMDEQTFSNPSGCQNVFKADFDRHGLSNQCTNAGSVGLVQVNQDTDTGFNLSHFTATAPEASWGSENCSFEMNRNEPNIPDGQAVISGHDENCIMDLDTADLVTGDYMKDFFHSEDKWSGNKPRCSEQVSHCSTVLNISSCNTSGNSAIQQNGSNPASTTSLLQYTSPSSTSVGNMLQLHAADTSSCDMSQSKDSTSDLSHTLSSAFDMHMARFKSLYSDMLEILENKRAMPVHPIVPGAKATVYRQLIGSIQDINKAIIGFCNCVPGLSSLPKEDKDYLTKRAYYDIWMLANSRLFHKNQTYLRLPDGTYYTRDWMEVILNKKIVGVFFNFSVAFNALELSDLEVAILCAIQLTSPGNESPGVCPISCKEKVEHINSQLVDLLVLEVGRRHKSSGPRVLVDIFRLLPKLAEINTLQQEIIANFTADTVPENVMYSPKEKPLADLSEDQLNAV